MRKKKIKKVEEDFFKDDGLPSKWKMRKEINTLRNNNEVLEEIIKSELYKAFMDKLGEPETIKRLREDNKKLRLTIKSLKEEIRNANSKK